MATPQYNTEQSTEGCYAVINIHSKYIKISFDWVRCCIPNSQNGRKQTYYRRAGQEKYGAYIQPSIDEFSLVA